MCLNYKSLIAGWILRASADALVDPIEQWHSWSWKSNNPTFILEIEGWLGPF